MGGRGREWQGGGGSGDRGEGEEVVRGDVGGERGWGGDGAQQRADTSEIWRLAFGN